MPLLTSHMDLQLARYLKIPAEQVINPNSDYWISEVQRAIALAIEMGIAIQLPQKYTTLSARDAALGLYHKYAKEVESAFSDLPKAEIFSLKKYAQGKKIPLNEGFFLLFISPL